MAEILGVAALKKWVIASDGQSTDAHIFAAGPTPFVSFASKFSRLAWTEYGAEFPEIAQRASALDQQLSDLRDDTIDALTELISLGDTIQGWISRYPSIPEEDAELAEFEGYRERAYAACKRAQHLAASANNRFAPLTNSAREFDDAVQRTMKRVEDDIEARRRATQQEIKNLSPPWYVFLGGLIAVAAWMVAEEQRLKSELNSAVGQLQAQLSWLSSQRASAASFQGQLLSWKDMTAGVSSSLAGTYNILSAMQGQVLEDPTLYAELIAVEWSEVVQEAQHALALLQAGTA